MSEEITQNEGLSRRTMLRLGAAGGVGVALTGATIGAPFLEKTGLLTPDGAFGASGTALADSLFYIEAFPTSPLILKPFVDPLVVPKALRPEPSSAYTGWAQPPGPGVGQQNSLGNQQHQLWPGQTPWSSTLNSYPDPLVYKIEVKVNSHAFTTSPVRLEDMFRYTCRIPVSESA